MVVIYPFMLDNLCKQAESHNVDAYTVDEVFTTSLGRNIFILELMKVTS
jgi:hypothetical protein